MTPKEKAEKLHIIMLNEIKQITQSLTVEKIAKKFALILAIEMLIEYKSIVEKPSIRSEYWVQVTKEIENL